MCGDGFLVARDFDGSNDVLTTADLAALRPSLPVTIAAWVWPDTLTAGMSVFSNNKSTTQHRGVWFGVSAGTGVLEANYGDNTGSSSADRRSVVSTGTIATGSWQHIATRVRGAADMDLNIAGADAGATFSGTGGGVAYAGGIGTMIGRSNVFWNGKIAEVGFWNVSLSAAELLALAKGVSPRRIRPDALLGYWPVYGQASPEAEIGGGGYNATVTEATLFDHAPVGPYLVAA